MHEVIVKNGLGEVKFNLDDSGWLKRYRDYLHNGRITVINDEGPNFSVNTRGHRWVMFYRKFHRFNDPEGHNGEVRLLCVGWQSTIGGKNVKALNWIYPNGTIEASEEPEFWTLFVR